MSASFTNTTNTISKQFEDMLKRSRMMQGWLNTVAYRTYQNAQRKRWMTENASQGTEWKRIDSVYAKKKLTKFASYDGGGRKMLIATGRLFKSVIGPSQDQRKLTSSTSITIMTTVKYASYVDSERSFTEFSPEFKKELRSKAMQYMARGKQ